MSTEEVKTETPVTLNDIMHMMKDMTAALKTLADNVKALEKEFDRWRRAGKY